MCYVGLQISLEKKTLQNNNNNEYLECLTCTGPKRLHVLYKDILSKFNAYNMNAHTHARTPTDPHTHACTHARTHTHIQEQVALAAFLLAAVCTWKRTFLFVFCSRLWLACAQILLNTVLWSSRLQWTRLSCSSFLNCHSLLWDCAVLFVIHLILRWPIFGRKFGSGKAIVSGDITWQCHVMSCWHSMTENPHCMMTVFHVASV